MQEQDPKSVMQRLADAINGGDLETVVGLFTDDGIFRLSPAPPEIGLFEGKDQIRAWFKELIDDNTRVEPMDIRVDGDSALAQVRVSRDLFRQGGVDHVVNDAEAIVKGGRILFFRSKMSPEAFEKLKPIIMSRAKH